MRKPSFLGFLVAWLTQRPIDIFDLIFAVYIGIGLYYLGVDYFLCFVIGWQYLLTRRLECHEVMIHWHDSPLELEMKKTKVVNLNNVSMPQDLKKELDDAVAILGKASESGDELSSEVKDHIEDVMRRVVCHQEGLDPDSISLDAISVKSLDKKGDKGNGSQAED